MRRACMRRAGAGRRQLESNSICARILQEATSRRKAASADACADSPAAETRVRAEGGTNGGRKLHKHDFLIRRLLHGLVPKARHLALPFLLCLPRCLHLPLLLLDEQLVVV